MSKQYRPVPSRILPAMKSLANWLGLMEPARGESCFAGQRRGPAVPGEDRVASPVRIPSISLQPNNSGTKTEIPPVNTVSQGVKPQPNWLVDDWMRLMEPARGESCPSGQRLEVPPRQGRIRFYPRMRTPSISQQLQQPGDEKRDRPGRYRPTRCGNPNPTLGDC